MVGANPGDFHCRYNEVLASVPAEPPNRPSGTPFWLGTRKMLVFFGSALVAIDVGSSLVSGSAADATSIGAGALPSA